MNTLRKCIALSITVATSVVIASCTSQPKTAAVTETPPDVLVDNARVPTAAELYGERYRTGVTQIRDGDRVRFVECPSCAGATPKTSIVNVQEAARRKAREALVAREQARAQAAAQTTRSELPRAELQRVSTRAAMPTTTPASKDTADETSSKSVDPIPTAFAKGIASGVTSSVTGVGVALNLEFAENILSEPPADLGEPLDVVIFRGGSAWLDPKSEDQLKQLADAWVAASSVDGSESRPLLIAGFTDSWPTKTPSFNEYLARRRAEVVREVLLRHGVPEDAMKVVHHVQCCYVADNQTAEGRAKNRRTEIHVL